MSAAQLAGGLVAPAAPSQDVVATRHRPRDAVVRRGLAVADLLAVGAVLFAGPLTTAAGAKWYLAALPAWSLLLRAYGLYDRDSRRLTRGTLDELPAVAHATLVGCLLLALFAVATPAPAVGAWGLAQLGLLAAAAVLAARFSARRWLRRVLGAERALLVGDAASIASLARKLSGREAAGVEPVGAVCDGDTAPGLPVLARPDAVDLAVLRAAHRIDRVVVAGHATPGGSLAECIRAAHRLRITVDHVPEPFTALGARVEVDEINGITSLGFHPPLVSLTSRCVKRVVDVGCAVALLVATAPVLVVAAIAIKLDSSGPVLFRQRRVGRGGRSFTMAKLRTMVVGADGLTDELLPLSRDPHWLLLERDPRVTRVGAFLRRSSIDELPQLWNVLRGEMTLVGPRPLTERDDLEVTGWSRCRLDVKPGLTGLWQVLGRTTIPFEDMVRLDCAYATNHSTWRDIQLLLRTLPALLTRRGAN